MPIRVDYSPVPLLANLAWAAGEAAAEREQQHEDLAYSQMILSTRLAQIQEQRVRDQMAQAATAQSRQQDLAVTQMGISANLQLRQMAQTEATSERAFELQLAHAEQQARTTMARAQAVSPLATSLQNQLLRQGFEQEEQQASLSQLEQMLATGTIDQAAYERAKLGILTEAEGLVTAAIRPREAKSLTPGQQLDVIRTPYRDERRRTERELSLYKRMMAEYQLEPDQQQKIQQQIDALLRQLDQLEQAENTAIQQTGLMPATAPAVKGSVTVEPLPADPKQLQTGHIYALPQGQTGRWTGQGFEVVVVGE